MKKLVLAMPAAIMAIMLFAGIASAHVVVYPKETTQGSYEKFTVRVPAEKDTPTVKVEVKVPQEVDISRLEPMAGWKYELIKDGAGKIVSIVWTATGEGLSSTEFGEFNMQGKVGDKAAKIVWKAYQTYKDGSVVEWTGAPDEKTPASVTAVKAKAAGAAAGDHDTGASIDTETAGGSEGSLPLYLSIAALVLGLIALLLSLRRRTS